METETDKKALADTRGTTRIALQDGLILVSCIAWLTVLFVALSRLSPPLPDFTDMEPSERKAAFFDYLEPIIEKVNERSLADRQSVEKLLAKHAAGNDLSWFEQRRLSTLADKYEVDNDERPVDAVLEDLRRRTGVVPESLVLIQAAKESGWGTSRFALEGNNLFGQRCYESDCGIAPRGRSNPRFGLASFASVEQSIESYVRNLNTHPEYRPFRELRAVLRRQKEALSGLELAQGLLGYSERGQAYVDEIRAMIRQNDLE